MRHAPFEPVCIVIDILVSFGFKMAGVWQSVRSGFAQARLRRLAAVCEDLVDRAAVNAHPVRLPDRAFAARTTRACCSCCAIAAATWPLRNRFRRATRKRTFLSMVGVVVDWKGAGTRIERWRRVAVRQRAVWRNIRMGGNQTADHVASPVE